MQLAESEAIIMGNDIAVTGEDRPGRTFKPSLGV